MYVFVGDGFSFPVVGTKGRRLSVVADSYLSCGDLGTSGPGASVVSSGRSILVVVLSYIDGRFVAQFGWCGYSNVMDSKCFPGYRLSWRVPSSASFVLCRGLSGGATVC